MTILSACAMCGCPLAMHHPDRTKPGQVWCGGCGSSLCPPSEPSQPRVLPPPARLTAIDRLLDRLGALLGVMW